MEIGMQEQEYIELVRNVRTAIYENKLEEAEIQLQELYKYKPVRLLWFVAMAELRWKQKRYNEVFGSLGTKLELLYNYPGIEEYAEFLDNYMNVQWDEIEKTRNYAIFSRILGRDRYPYTTEYLEKAYTQCVENDTDENLYQLMEAYRKNNAMLTQQIIRYWLRKTGYIQEKKDNYYYKIDNFDYLEEKLLHSKDTFILVQTEENRNECDVIISILHQLEHPVYLLTIPEDAEDISVELSLKRGQVYPDATLIPVLRGPKGETNLPELLQCLCELYIENRFAILLASGKDFEMLMQSPVIQKHVECLQVCRAAVFGDIMYFGWVGDYQRYISDIYDFDVEEQINKEPNCEFSIVVPARNSAGTLYYTLQTCLNQDYTGSYEIIVSDNSTNGKQEVYQVCQDLNDPRIKYVKTPRDLQLTKSFEFAFLQARGEFIFSIGSDDGVCPWALSVMKKFLDEHPHDEVLQWKRGYYAWNGFEGGEEDKLVIPGKFDRNNIALKKKSNLDYFAEVMKYSSYMYGLPTMYLNSGFRRSYFKTLLQKTGRLWDGCNQDLYMGIITAAINSHILVIDFPLIIAGMSNNSLGYVVGKSAGQDATSKKDREILKSSHRGANIGIYVLNGIVYDIPIGKGEVFSLYANFMRAIQLGVLPEAWKEELFDYKKIFTEFFEEHTYLDDEYDKYLHCARFVAMQRGEEFLKWFDENIYEPAVIPKYYNKKTIENKKKSYQVGISPAGGLILDASYYGVSNIAEAVKLFERFVYWTPESWEEECIMAD